MPGLPQLIFGSPTKTAVLAFLVLMAALRITPSYPNIFEILITLTHMDRAKVKGLSHDTIYSKSGIFVQYL